MKKMGKKGLMRGALSQMFGRGGMAGGGLPPGLSMLGKKK